MDAGLLPVASALESTRLAAVICDTQWRLVWVSEELRALLGEQDEGKLGIGKHLVEVCPSPVLR